VVPHHLLHRHRHRHHPGLRCVREKRKLPALEGFLPLPLPLPLLHRQGGNRTTMRKKGKG
jgi:hypothetical protein